MSKKFTLAVAILGGGLLLMGGCGDGGDTTPAQLAPLEGTLQGNYDYMLWP